MNDNRPPDCAIFLLAKAYQRGHGLIKSLLKPYGLTNMQHLVLEGVWYREGCTSADLGRMLVLDKATLSGVIDRLCEADWLERREMAGDKRSYRLHSSRKARDAKQELIELRQQANDELLSSFSLEERLLFKRLLWDLMGPNEFR